MTRVHVIGAAGYAALETIRYVLRHPSLDVGTLESASHAGESLAAHAPLLRDSTVIFAERGSVLEAVTAGDVVVLAGTHGIARELAPALLAAGARIVDLSDDFRLHDRADVANVRAVYGFTERYRDALRTARLVANPGCYPTATLLALWPLAPFAREIVHLVIDAKSGITGAGRNPTTGSLFAEVEADVRAYGLAGHRHEAEIGQELAALGLATPFVFTPHIVPLGRGMLVDAYAIFDRAPDDDAIRASYERVYGSNDFVRLLPPDRAPSLPAVARSTMAEIHVAVRGTVVRAICAIDNLGKGAAGQAVQNINVMLGLPEGSALDDRAIV